MDTRNFLGLKSTILYVTLVTASGREAEVRLGVTSNILADIVLNPGAVDFGTVMKGETASQTLTIDRIGTPGWRFERMVSASRVLTAQLTETRRDAKGSVSYTLNVGIKPDAPAGPVRDEIRLMSNDREAASMPIMVTGYIRGNLTAAPSILTMGEVASTAGKQGRYISAPSALRHHVHRRGRRRLLDRSRRRLSQDPASGDDGLQARGGDPAWRPPALSASTPTSRTNLPWT